MMTKRMRSSKILSVGIVLLAIYTGIVQQSYSAQAFHVVVTRPRPKKTTEATTRTNKDVRFESVFFAGPNPGSDVSIVARRRNILWPTYKSYNRCSGESNNSVNNIKNRSNSLAFAIAWPSKTLVWAALGVAIVQTLVSVVVAFQWTARVGERLQKEHLELYKEFVQSLQKGTPFTPAVLEQIETDLNGWRGKMMRKRFTVRGLIVE